MIDQLSRLDEEHLLFLALMAGLLLLVITVIICIVAVQIRMFRQRQLELGFREEMLRRGLSIDEITRILSGSRPTWSQSVTSLSDWAMSRVSRAAKALASQSETLLNHCRSLLSKAFDRGSRLIRRGWNIASAACQELWNESRPMLQNAKRRLGRCMTWAGNQLDNLARRLAPPQP